MKEKVYRFGIDGGRDKWFTYVGFMNKTKFLDLIAKRHIASKSWTSLHSTETHNEKEIKAAMATPGKLVKLVGGYQANSGDILEVLDEI